MPQRPGKACCKAGCSGVAVGGKSYCTQHKAYENSWARYQFGRTSSERGYGSQWRKLRLQILKRDNYLCQPHLKLNQLVHANIVDHIRAKAHGGTDCDSNLQAICDKCHKTKTATERLGNMSMQSQCTDKNKKLSKRKYQYSW